MARQQRIQISYWRMDDLKPDPKNPRRNEMAVQPVLESIRQFGMRVPLVIDKNGNIIAGHTRFKACMELGIKEVPCVTADQLNKKQLLAFGAADNKTSEFATWDQALLESELDDLASVFQIADFGFAQQTANEKAKDPNRNKDPFDDGSEINPGMVLCPRCGKWFKPETGKHFDPFDEDAEEEDLF